MLVLWFLWFMSRCASQGWPPRDVPRQAECGGCGSRDHPVWRGVDCGPLCCSACAERGRAAADYLEYLDDHLA